MIKKIIFITIVAFFAKAIDIDWGIEYNDPYYMNTNLTIGLSNEPIQTIVEKNEFLLYKNLLFDSLIPKFLYLEASLNAMPTAGSIWKYYHVNSYNALSIYDVNLVETLFSGFEEPYAFSVFLGKVVKFGVEGQKIDDNNKGFVGYLVSFGQWHIKDMEFIEDNWVEIEGKVKGKKVVTTQTLDWSFRIGAKLHQNPYISDTVYFGIKRSNVDTENTIPIISNSAIEYRMDIKMDSFEIIRNYLTLEKKYLLFHSKKAISLVMGFVHEKQNKYSGILKRDGDDNFSIIIRPNISF